MYKFCNDAVIDVCDASACIALKRASGTSRNLAPLAHNTWPEYAVSVLHPLC